MSWLQPIQHSFWLLRFVCIAPRKRKNEYTLCGKRNWAMQRYIHEIAAKNKQTKQQCEDGIDNTTKKKNNNGKSLSSNSKNPALVTIHFFFAFSMCCREVIYAENKIIKWSVLRRICFGRLFFSKPKIIIKAVRYDYLFWKGKNVETRKIAQTKLIRGTKKPYFSVNWKENHNETFFLFHFCIQFISPRTGKNFY